MPVQRRTASSVWAVNVIHWSNTTPRYRTAGEPETVAPINLGVSMGFEEFICSEKSALCIHANNSICIWPLQGGIPTTFKGTNPALKKSSNIPEIYAKMFGRFH